MRKAVGLRHLLGLALLLLLLVLPALASGATSVRAFPASPYRAERIALPSAPPLRVGAHALVRFGVAPGYAAAGVQGTSPGLQGTTVVLAACARACTDSYRPASSPAIAAGHFAERIVFAVTQPARTGTAVGFDVDIGVYTATGWVFGVGYFSTGLSTAAAASTITLRVFVDLGALRPVVTAVEVTVNTCNSTTACP
jgi:hypothetical protein